VDSTSELIRASRFLFEQIFEPGGIYKKCGIALYDLSSKSEIQLSLFQDLNKNAAEDRKSWIMDEINKKLGPKTIQIAAVGTSAPWEMLSQFRSPNYTTCWSDIPVVRI
jgi:DNA polymerase V